MIIRNYNGNNFVHREVLTKTAADSVVGSVVVCIILLYQAT